jgi:hypothetical protein
MFIDVIDGTVSMIGEFLNNILALDTLKGSPKNRFTYLSADLSRPAAPRKLDIS